MTARAGRSRDLAKALRGLGANAMSVEELDGFLAGILVCPAMIPPSAWLSRIWSAEGAGDPVFEDIDHVNRVMGLVTERYNDVARTLFERPQRYAPMIGKEQPGREPAWCGWARGFDKAVELDPQAWRDVLDDEAAAADALARLMALARLARERQPGADAGVMTAQVCDLIAACVVDLNAWRLENHRPPGMHRTGARPAPTVGRNEPCPCGSGKKYKKCCGLN